MKFRMKENVGNHRERSDVYVSGQVLESTRNLAQLHPDKFEQVPDDTPVSAPHQSPHAVNVPGNETEDEEINLEDMSVSELKALAKEEGVDVKGLRKKSELIAALENKDDDDEDEDSEEDDDDDDFEDEDDDE